MRKVRGHSLRHRLYRPVALPVEDTQCVTVTFAEKSRTGTSTSKSGTCVTRAWRSSLSVPTGTSMSPLRTNTKMRRKERKRWTEDIRAIVRTLRDASSMRMVMQAALTAKGIEAKYSPRVIHGAPHAEHTSAKPSRSSATASGTAGRVQHGEKRATLAGGLFPSDLCCFPRCGTSLFRCELCSASLAPLFPTGASK